MSTLPLTTDQIGDFYQALEHADEAAAELRNRFLGNACKLIQQLKNCNAAEAFEQAVKLKNQCQKFSTQRLDTETIVALLEPPRSAVAGDDESEQEQAAYGVLYRVLRRPKSMMWRLPDEAFSEEVAGPVNADFVGIHAVDIIRRYADAVIRQAILPEVGKDSEPVVRTLRELIATAVSLRSFSFSSVEDANRFFRDAYRRFTETRDRDVADFLALRLDELQSKIGRWLTRWAPVEKRDDLASKAYLRIVETLKRPMKPSPRQQFESEASFWAWAKKLSRNLAIDDHRENDEQGFEGDPPDPDPNFGNDDQQETPQHWMLVSHSLNRSLELAFGAESLLSDIDAANREFGRGGAVAFLMLYRRTNVDGLSGLTRDAAIEEIARALRGESSFVWTQFGDRHGSCSPESIWRQHCRAWDGILNWPGELPRLRLPESWDQVRSLFADATDDLSRTLKRLLGDWEDFIKSLNHLRIGSVLLSLTHTPLLGIGKDRVPAPLKRVTRQQVSAMLTSSSDLRMVDETGRCFFTAQSCWSQIVETFSQLGFPESWEEIQSWFDGRLPGKDDDALFRKYLDRGLKERLQESYPERRLPAAEPGSRIPCAWNGPEGISDVIRVGGMWYVATSGVEQSSGRHGIQVLGSSTGERWEQCGQGIILDDCELSSPRFIRIGPGNERGDDVLPAIQCDVKLSETTRRVPMVLQYSAASGGWLAPRSFTPDGRFVSRVVWCDGHAFAVIRTRGADGANTVALCMGSELPQLASVVDLSVSVRRQHSDTAAASVADDLPLATDATLFSEGRDLWCVAHCAGADWRRTWIGVCTLDDVGCWEWWKAGTAMFSDHRYVIPDQTERCSAAHRDCALKPAAACCMPDGSWWLSGTAHVAGLQTSEDVLCRVFLPSRRGDVDSHDAAALIFCQTRRLGRNQASELRHVGTACDGRIVVTTFHRSAWHDFDALRRSTQHLCSRKFRVIGSDSDTDLNV